MLSRGMKKVCFVRGVLENYDSIERERGFRERLAKSGIELEPEYILNGGFEREMAHDSMLEFIGKGMPLPEAVFAGNDLSAFGVIDALTESGYRVPQDLIVLGVDDIEECNWYSPKLSTLKTDFEKEGVMAVEKLVKMINGEESGEIIKLPSHLIERESTLQLKK